MDDKTEHEYQMEIISLRMEVVGLEDRLKELEILSDDLIYGTIDGDRFIPCGITDNEENAIKLHDLLADVVVEYDENDDYDEDGDKC